MTGSAAPQPLMRSDIRHGFHGVSQLPRPGSRAPPRRNHRPAIEQDFLRRFSAPLQGYIRSDFEQMHPIRLTIEQQGRGHGHAERMDLNPHTTAQSGATHTLLTHALRPASASVAHHRHLTDPACRPPPAGLVPPIEKILNCCLNRHFRGGAGGLREPDSLTFKNGESLDRLTGTHGTTGTLLVNP